MTLLAEFITTCRARYSDDTSTTTMSDWIRKNTHLKRRPFSFEGFEFQEQIVNDMHADLCCIKPSQVGLTESQLRKYLGFLRRNLALTGIYTMPDDKMRDRVSQTRVKPLVDTEQVFNPPSTDKPIRQKGLYQIGDSFAYFTGSTEGDATSIPADILIHDELDLTDQQMIGLFQSRLQMSQHKIVQRFSTPTYLGYGIDAVYGASDQHEYFTRCPSCRHFQLPEFHPRFLGLPNAPAFRVDDLTRMTVDDIDNLNTEGAHWRCERCSKPLSLGDPSLREWVAKHPGKKTRGYKVRPTSVDKITIPYMFTQLKRYQLADNLRGFRNTVLGEADNDGDARLSEEDILNCMGSQGAPVITPGTECFIGIDIGAICHIVVGTEKGVFQWLQVPQRDLIERVTGLLKTYNIIAGCVDRYPYTPTAEALRDITDHKGTIMPVGYATTANSPPLAEGKDEFDEVTHWVANRTRALDTVQGAVRNKKLLFEGFGALKSIIVTHLRDMVRIEGPDKPPFWNKLNGDDHFFHALGYMLLSQRMVLARNFRADREQRTTILLYGLQPFKTPDLSPRSLNHSPLSDLGPGGFIR